MDLTEVHGNGPRKSLASRRVSFAAHTHVRLFHIQSPDVAGSNSGSSPAAPSPESGAPPAFITRAENDENAVPGQANRRNSRRSSGAFSEFGERSMDMDMDDTAPLPQDFLPQRGVLVDGSAVEDDEFTEDDDDESDMEVTEAIARNMERKRSLSLGGRKASLPAPRRNSVVTATQHQRENLPPPHGEDVAEEGESFADGEDVTASSAHTGSSYMSEGSSGEPMEFTIPVLQSMREPKEPDPLWLQLRAMTHAGSEPYEPPPPESDDDALLIQPSPGQGMYSALRHDQARLMDDYEDDDDDGQDMDLTSAMTRLHKARMSLGLPASPGPSTAVRPAAQEDSFEEEQAQEAEIRDDTFSTEDSFGDEEADLHNITINITQRTSLGTLEDSSMDENEVPVKMPVTPGSAPTRQPPPPNASTSQAPGPAAFRSSVFSAPTSATPSSSVFSAPAPAAFSSSVFSAPPPVAPKATNVHDPPRSPSKSPGPATIPKPFSFSLPRAGSPSKPASQAKPPAQPQPHRGTAAFAPPSIPKSPKRPADDAHVNAPESAQRPSVGRLSPSRTAAFESDTQSASQPVAGAQANRRVSISAVRRTSSYFAQRKSLGGGALPPNSNANRASSPEKVSGGAGLNKPRASVGAQPSGLGLGLPRTQSDPGPAARNRTNHAEALYPDLSQLASESGAVSHAFAASRDKGKGRAGEPETIRPAVVAPTPTPPSATAGLASPALPQRVASPAGVPLAQEPTVPPASQPLGEQRIIDVSMAVDMDMDEDMTDPSPPTGAGVSQSWREGVPEEPLQSDDEVGRMRWLACRCECSSPTRCSLPFQLSSSSR